VDEKNAVEGVLAFGAVGAEPLLGSRNPAAQQSRLL